MDYADGGDLSMKIKEQNGVLFPEDKILDWFTQVCLAIKHIHDRKILHRDIKSQNIFLTKNGQVKLGDFGIAKCLNQAQDKAKTYVGTPYYLSPEIINSQPYGFKSDIWSLGVLLYEMCALKMPFDASNLPQLYIKIINCSYQPLNNMYSNELKELVKEMLNETSVKRPTISEILNKPIIKSRIKKFLNESEFSMEFSHTILHDFKLNSNIIDEKMTKNELISNNNINNNNNNFKKNIRGSQGHKKPIIKKELNEKNLRASANETKNISYQMQNEKEQNRINLLKKNLEVKPSNSNSKQIKQGLGKYNGNNLHSYNIYGFNKNNAQGFFIINEVKDYKRNDTGRNRKSKNAEYSSDKMNKNNYIKNNNINNIESSYNGLKIENSSKYNNSNKKRMDYDKKNNLNNNNNNNIFNNNNSNSHREKDKERKQKLEEVKKKFRRENKKVISNQDGVIWMRGMENYHEKKDETTNISNIITGISESMGNEQNEGEKIKYKEIILNSNKKEISGKNLLPLNSITNINLNNNYSNDYINEEEINNNNKLYEDMMKENNLNFAENNNFNGIKNNNQDIFINLPDELNYENNIEINEDKVTEDVWKEISNNFESDLLQSICNIIKKDINDDMLSYDYNKLVENILKDLKYKNISQNLIENAINKIPDIYFLILCKKL